MTIEYMDDVERKVKRREKDKFKKEVAEDITDVAEEVLDRFENMFKRKEIIKKKKKGVLRRATEFFLFSGLALLIANFVLANIWLVKTLIKSLFGIK